MDPVYLTEEHNILRETARRYIEEEVEPHGDAWEEAEEIPRDHRIGISLNLRK